MDTQMDNPNALLNIYQSLNDQQLAQIANTPGNPYSFLAVGVAQQRAKERMGAAAMQPQQPTVRDQAVGQMMQAGLAAAPENIAPTMATGGLVALAHGGPVRGFATGRSIMELARTIPDSPGYFESGDLLDAAIRGEGYNLPSEMQAAREARLRARLSGVEPSPSSYQLRGGMYEAPTPETPYVGSEAEMERLNRAIAEKRQLDALYELGGEGSSQLKAKAGSENADEMRRLTEKGHSEWQQRKLGAQGSEGSEALRRSGYASEAERLDDVIKQQRGMQGLSEQGIASLRQTRAAETARAEAEAAARAHGNLKAYLERERAIQNAPAERAAAEARKAAEAQGKWVESLSQSSALPQDIAKTEADLLRQRKWNALSELGAAPESTMPTPEPAPRGPRLSVAEKDAFDKLSPEAREYIKARNLSEVESGLAKSAAPEAVSDIAKLGESAQRLNPWTGEVEVAGKGAADLLAKGKNLAKMSGEGLLMSAASESPLGLSLPVATKLAASKLPGGKSPDISPREARGLYDLINTFQHPISGSLAAGRHTVENVAEDVKSLWEGAKGFPSYAQRALWYLNPPSDGEAQEGAPATPESKTPEGATVNRKAADTAKHAGAQTENERLLATVRSSSTPATPSPGIPSAASSSSTPLMNPSSQLVSGESYGVPEKAAQPAAEAYSPEETIAELMRLRGGAYQYPKELMDKLAEREAAANTEKWLSAGLAGLSGAMGAQTPWRGQAIAEGLRQGLSQYEKGSAAEDAAALANLKMQMEQAKAPYDARGEGYKTYVDMLKAKATAEAGIDKALINAQRAVYVQRLRNEGYAGGQYGAYKDIQAQADLSRIRDSFAEEAERRFPSILDSSRKDNAANREAYIAAQMAPYKAMYPQFFSGMGSGAVAPVMQSPYATILHH